MSWFQDTDHQWYGFEARCQHHKANWSISTKPSAWVCHLPKLKVQDSMGLSGTTLMGVICSECAECSCFRQIKFHTSPAVWLLWGTDKTPWASTPINSIYSKDKGYIANCTLVARIYHILPKLGPRSKISQLQIKLVQSVLFPWKVHLPIQNIQLCKKHWRRSNVQEEGHSQLLLYTCCCWYEQAHDKEALQIELVYWLLNGLYT